MNSRKKNRYNWEEIQKFCDQGKTRKDILEIFGIHTNTLYSAIKRGDLIYKSKFDQFDWSNIQKYYDIGKTWEETQEKFNLNVSQLNKAKKLGLFKSRDKSEARKNSCKNGRSVSKRSEVTKNKISESMKQFLLNNPDKKNIGVAREGSGRSKSGYYKGIYCGSTYELVWVIYRLDHGLHVQRFEGHILYDNNKRYFPDFVEGNIIHEMKGWTNHEINEILLKKEAGAKVAGYKVILYFKQDLIKEFDWVKSNYNYSKLQDLYD